MYRLKKVLLLPIEFCFYVTITKIKRADYGEKIEGRTTISTLLVSVPTSIETLISISDVNEQFNNIHQMSIVNIFFSSLFF